MSRQQESQTIVDDLSKKAAGDVAAVLRRAAMLMPPSATAMIFIEAARTAVAAAAASVAVVGFPQFDFTTDKENAHRVLVFVGLLLAHQNKVGDGHAALDASDDLDALMVAGRVPRDDGFTANMRDLFSAGQRTAAAG